MEKKIIGNKLVMAYNLLTYYYYYIVVLSILLFSVGSIEGKASLRKGIIG